MEHEEQHNTRANSQPYLVPFAIIVAGLIISAAIFYKGNVNGGNGTPTAGGPAQIIGDDTVPNEAPREVSEDDDPFIGNPDAKVVLIEFADFQCPFCGRFFLDTMPQIKEAYIKTGKAKLVYRDFPLRSIHPYAQKAAEASECANAGGKFWQYHDYLYTNQEALTEPDLIKAAEAAGLKKTEFAACLSNSTYKSEVDKDYNDGVAAGVSGTPTVFINGRPVVGAQPFEVLAQVIEQELAK